MAKKSIVGAAEPYVPTEREAAAISRTKKRMMDRRKLPKLSITVDEKGVANIAPEHPDLGTASAMDLDAFGLGANGEFTSLLKGVVNFSTKNGRADEEQANEALQLIVGIGPRNTTEAMLAVQMAAVHLATLEAARRMHRTTLEVEAVSVNTKTLANLARTFAMQVETMKKLKGGGQQKVVVEHKHYYLAPGAIANSQAILGGVSQGRGTNEITQQPHELETGIPSRTAMHGDLEANGVPLQSAGSPWMEGMPLPWSEGRGA